jgi:superfamily I DNA/RNA helicase
VSISLNPEQLAGVEAVDGDYVMIAGPGSGKTRVLVERYLRMRARGIPDRDILNLTFTNAAATEMVERVGLLNSAEVFRTFHSFCLALLKQERAYLPFPVIDTIIPVRGEQFMLMKELLKVYPAIMSYFALSDSINEWKSGNVSPAEAMQETESQGASYFHALAYRDYERRMREEGWLDFDALVKETVALLENNDAVRLRNQRKYIAVDECQDTDTTQFRLLQLLYAGNIFVVGDENQLIYEWRSAQAGNLTNFSRTFRGARTLFLGTNYRSTQKLVDFFKKILPVDNGLASHMVSARPEGEAPRIIHYWGEDEEANEVLNDITDRGIIEETAILARTNRQLQLIQRRAMSRNLRAEIIGKKNVWQENEVKHLIDLTKENFNDQRPAAVVMQSLIHSHNLVNRYANTKNRSMEKDPVENLNDIVRMAGRKNKATGKPLSVLEFLEWMRRITHMRKRKGDPILTLSTVHQAKGREWKYVYVVGANQGTMPHNNGDLLEEHRIFFVACSRAADELQISYSENLTQFLNDFREDVEQFGEEDEQIPNE